MDELPDLPALETLEPPPGGLAALRTRLDASHRPWWLVIVPAVALAIVVLVVLTRPRPPLEEVAQPSTTIRDREVRADGTFYWVASTPGPLPMRGRRATISIDQAPVVSDYVAP
jgi:hypothetical protein